MESRREPLGRPFDHYDMQTPCHPWLYDSDRCTLDGTILFPRRLPGSKVAWEFAPDWSDADHLNRDGGEPRRITRGIADRGADHPVWLSVR